MGEVVPTPDAAPKGVKKRKKKVVLTEDEYEDALDQIVQKRFYPDLQKLKDHDAWLTAKRQGDEERMLQIKEKYERRGGRRRERNDVFQTPVFSTPTPSGGDTPTPGQTPQRMTRRKKEKKGIPLSSLSLSQFFHTYISEDNQSLDELVDQDEEKRQKLIEKYNKLSNVKLLSMPGNSGVRYGEIETANRVLGLYPSGAGTHAKVDVSGLKVVDHKNTRLQHHIAQPQGKVQKKRKKKKYSGSISLSSFYEGDSSSEEEEEPNVGGFTFISSPTIEPGKGGDNPMMTWGSIDQTPAVLEAAQTPLTAVRGDAVFRVPDTPKRELVLRKLDRKATVEKKKPKVVASPMRTPKLDGMTSALRASYKSPSVRRSMRSPSVTPVRKRSAPSPIFYSKRKRSKTSL